MKTTQHMAALEYGNSVRILMADEKRRIKEQGLDRVLDTLASERLPHHVARMPLHHVLNALDQMGPERTHRVLRLAGMGAHRYMTRLGELTDRERESLTLVLKARR